MHVIEADKIYFFYIYNAIVAELTNCMHMTLTVKDNSTRNLRNELLRQRKELTDSLYYASYIQSALLPSRDEWNRLLPESFIYYNPRDIVSGDFYWIKKYREFISIVVADCTGHGVPGGFMSVLGISFINEIFSKGCVVTAKSVLNQLREKVMKALHQTGGNSEPKDGMDISLCIINCETNQMQFSGANQSIYLLHDRILTEFKGDLMPIGIGGLQEHSFSNHEMELQPGDTIYMFTDGFADQFGGNQDKKFKYSSLRQLILELQIFSLPEQGIKIAETFDIWKGNSMQVDDVLMTGFRYLPMLSRD